MLFKRFISFVSAFCLLFHITCAVFAENVATPATTSVTNEIYDVETGEPLAESLDELADIVENNEKFNFANDDVLTVIVPSKLDFTIDPFEVSGKGQIYSDVFLIQNYSNEDVAVRLENIKYIFANDDDFLSLDAPPDIPFGLAHNSDLKEIYMVLHYENRDWENFLITAKERSETADIILRAAEYDSEGKFVALNEESTLSFSFSGMVNHMPAKQWENKDVTVSIEYTMTALPCTSEPETPEDVEMDEENLEIVEGTTLDEENASESAQTDESEAETVPEAENNVVHEQPETTEHFEDSTAKEGIETPKADAVIVDEPVDKTTSSED